MNEYIPTVAAAAGATVLDIVRPGWFRDIDLFTLDLSEPDFCILGQLWGWEEGTRQTDCHYEREKQNALGFDIPNRLYRSNFGHDLMFELLTRAWKDEVNQRLNAS